MPPVDPFTLGLGALQTGLGIYGLSKLGKQQYPQYSVSPEMQHSYDRAEAMSGQGYSGQEKAAFFQSLAQSNSNRLQRGLKMAGGNLGAALNASANANDVNALNSFAASDANMNRQNIRYSDTLAQALQHQKNLQVQNQVQRRERMEQAYGGAVKQGLQNIVNPLNATAALKYLNGGSNLQRGLGSAGANFGSGLGPLGAGSAETGMTDWINQPYGG